MSSSAFGNILRCPYCAFHVTANSRVGAPGDNDGYRPPEPGAWSICANCAEVSRFDVDLGGGLRLRALTEEEAADVATDPFIQKVTGAARMAGDLMRARGEQP